MVLRKPKKMTHFDERELEDPVLKPSMVEPRECSSCKVVKPADDFYVGTSYRVVKRTNEVKKQMKRCSECRECMKARSKVWREANADRFKTYQALYKRKKRRQLRRHRELV